LESARPAQLYRALSWALDGRLFARLRVHGNTRWAVREFVLLALFWTWSDCPTLTGAFAHARHWCRVLLGKVVLKSYQGFAGALTTWTATLMPLLWDRLHQRMAAVAGGYWRIGGWLPLAVDGSRCTTPRTRANERGLNSPTFGRGAKARSRRKWKNKRRRRKPPAQPVHPQIWLTLLWHMGLKMPWAWRCGPSYASERHHLMELLQSRQFPEQTLFCGDAGFVGYELWQTILGQGQHFLMRVGGNVRLLRRLGRVRQRDDLLFFWPHTAAAARQPPLQLRLLSFQTGRCRVYAVTDVLDEGALPLRQAQLLYTNRWGVELQFRAFKQTFGRRKLRSRIPARAYAELEWSLLGLWLIQLLAAAEQIPWGIDPGRGSVSLAVQIFREVMWGGQPIGWREQLRGAVKDSYQRRSKKAARYRPQKKDKPAAGKPVIVTANAKLKKIYRRFHMAA
jgi:hypothetical protein